MRGPRAASWASPPVPPPDASQLHSAKAVVTPRACAPIQTTASSGRHRRCRRSRSDCSARPRAALLNRRATWRRARRHRPGAGGGRGGGRHSGHALMRSISVCRLVMRSSRLRILVASFCCLSVRPCVAAYARQSACRQHAFCLTTGSAGVQPFCSSSRSLQAPQHCSATPAGCRRAGPGWGRPARRGGAAGVLRLGHRVLAKAPGDAARARGVHLRLGHLRVALLPRLLCLRAVDLGFRVTAKCSPTIDTRVRTSHPAAQQHSSQHSGTKGMLLEGKQCTAWLAAARVQASCAISGAGRTSSAARWRRWSRVRPSSGMSSAGPQSRYMRVLCPKRSRSPTLRAACGPAVRLAPAHCRPPGRSPWAGADWALDAVAKVKALRVLRQGRHELAEHGRTLSRHRILCRRAVCRRSCREP